MSFNESVVDAANHNNTYVVESLTPYTNYTIKMAASTSVGRGGFGPEVTVETNESSELHLFHMSLPNPSPNPKPFPLYVASCLCLQ